MPIRIIRPARKFAVEIGGSMFMVRRMTDEEQTAFDTAHVPRSPERALAFIKAVIVGWDGVADETGALLPYDAALLPLLPWETVLEPILDRLRGGPDPLAARAASATLPPSPGTPNG